MWGIVLICIRKAFMPFYKSVSAILGYEGKGYWVIEENVQVLLILCLDIFPKISFSCHVAWLSFISETKSSELYSNIRKFFQFLWILHLSTVEFERGFSPRNLIKTDVRNHISTKVIDNLWVTNSCASEFQSRKNY